MFALPKHYDVAIVGSGHAGIEAALAATRLGCSTILLTQNLDTIGQMSCNPAIGGLAKGHIVREIDALGGFMGQNADATGIQFRMLNRTKGASVRAPRAQCDKKAYQFRAKAVLEATSGLDIKQATVQRVLVSGGRVTGLETDMGIAILCRAVVITSGTFLRGLLHVGMQSKPGGRMADTASNLSTSLRDLGFEVGRFKTGTPCRLNGRSIDFAKCEIQYGDDPPARFSYMPAPVTKETEVFTLNSATFHVEQVPCWITHTTDATHDVIRRSLHLSPLYAGRIEGTGPRYCPSIEDKVVKFADKPHHQIFLEPEGRQTEEFYLNGVSTSLPYEVQIEFIRSIPGLASAEIMRPGYAVEYDYFPPTQLQLTLETKLIEGLYFAGQINGTSGYEEAAAQGLIAGANAALQLAGRAPLVFDRSEAYIGVLIDDLVTRGTQEPYRMFTSRAEHRLILRQDNADQRLTPKAAAVGLVGANRVRLLAQKCQQLEMARESASRIRLGGETLLQLMKRPEFRLADLPPALRTEVSDEIWESLETDLKYEGYIRRHNEHLQSIQAAQGNKIPVEIDYASVPGLRNEARQKLAKIRPESIGQAGRISGVTPSDLGILTIWIRKNYVTH